jgi:XTP/dITP diphosphohydrolase
VHSARFAGESARDRDNNEKLLAELENVDKDSRGARFSCCIAFCQPDGSCITFSGQLPGNIIDEFRGNNGFGYDPLFLVSGYGKTLAELEMGIKNKISHRAAAFRGFMQHLAAAGPSKDGI